MFVGLVHTPDDSGPPSGDAGRPRAPWPRPPWRPFAWFAVFCWLLVAAGAVGGLPGYLVLLFALAVGCWRVDKWLAKQYWGGLTKR